MKLRFVLTALALGFLSFITAPRASAQVGVYLNPVVSHVGVSTPDTGPYAFLGDNTTGRFFGGVDFGGYWDFYHLPAFNLGVDIRETVLHGNNAGLDTFSVAPRIVSSHPIHHFIPYGEIGVGAGRSKAEESILHKTDFQFDVRVGADMHIGKYVDFRAIELSYGNVTVMSSYQERAPNCTPTGGITSIGGQPSTATTCVSIPAANLFSISSGLVFRFGETK